MKYNRHFDYEVYWAGMYYTFRYLTDARRFLKNKTGYTIHKVWKDKSGYWHEEFIESSNTRGFKA